MYLPDNTDITVEAHVMSVVADLPARAILLNISQFNGYFGCNFVFIKALAIGLAVAMSWSILTLVALPSDASITETPVYNFYNLIYVYIIIG